MLDEARETFRGVLDENDANPEAWLVIAQSHLVPGEDVLLSLDPVERAFELLPSSPAVKQVRTEALLFAGRRDDAVRGAGTGRCDAVRHRDR